MPDMQKGVSAKQIQERPESLFAFAVPAPKTAAEFSSLAKEESRIF